MAVTDRRLPSSSSKRRCACFPGMNRNSCALRWEDISLDEQVIRVQRTMQRIPSDATEGKKTKIAVTIPKSFSFIREIPLPERLTSESESGEAGSWRFSGTVLRMGKKNRANLQWGEKHPLIYDVEKVNGEIAIAR